jgi:hypothetical protein
MKQTQKQIFPRSLRENLYIYLLPYLYTSFPPKSLTIELRRRRRRNKLFYSFIAQRYLHERAEKSNTIKIYIYIYTYIICILYLFTLNIYCTGEQMKIIISSICVCMCVCVCVCSSNVVSCVIFFGRFLRYVLY